MELSKEYLQAVRIKLRKLGKSDEAIEDEINKIKNPGKAEEEEEVEEESEEEEEDADL